MLFLLTIKFYFGFTESSSSEEDDNAPPIRIFRNINAAAMNSRGYDVSFFFCLQTNFLI